MILLNPKIPMTLTLDSEKDFSESERTKFSVNVPTVQQEAQIKRAEHIVTPAKNKDEKATVEWVLYSAYQKAFEFCVSNVSPLKDSTGKDVEYSSEIMPQIPFDVRHEIGRKIYESMSQDIDTLKN